jgi:hypothetical protein
MKGILSLWQPRGQPWCLMATTIHFSEPRLCSPESDLLMSFRISRSTTVRRLEPQSTHRPCPSLEPSPDKFIARAVNCAEVHRIGWILFEFLPQTQYMCIDGPRGGIVVVAPHLIQQFGT